MVHQIQPVHLLDADDHDPEVLPCNGVVEIGDILAQFEVWIVGVLGDGVPWGWVFERACGFFFFLRQLRLEDMQSGGERK